MADQLWVSQAECLGCGFKWMVEHLLDAPNPQCPWCESFDTVRDWLPELESDE